jgi:bifunctional DNase/RNase
MVSVKIMTLVVTLPPTPSIIVLQPLGEDSAGDRILPIWIGPAEATSISVALEGRGRKRPMAHDLLADAISALGARVTKVVIDKVRDATFYATVYLEREGRTINIDARPSDSIALAVRVAAPLYVDEDVINSSAVPFNFGNTQEIKTNEMEEFRTFLDSITPEDFNIAD